MIYLAQIDQDQDQDQVSCDKTMQTAENSVFFWDMPENGICYCQLYLSPMFLICSANTER